MFNIRAINKSISIGILDLKAFSDHQNLSVKREIEKNGTQFLLNKMLPGQQTDLRYTRHNKPYLERRPEHLSISHSHDKLAIIINQIENTGIDIELIRDKVKSIKHKFLNAEEISWAKDDTETLVCFWAIKETLYKLHGLRKVDFKEHLFILECEDQKIIGKIDIGGVVKQYQLVKEKLEDYILIYTLNEI